MTESTEPTRRPGWPAVLTVVALASLPYLALLGANVGEVLELGRVARWWAVTLMVGLVPLAVASRFGRPAVRHTGAVVGVALYLFFNYPTVTQLRSAVGASMADLAWWALVAGVALAVAVPLTATATAQRFLAILAPALLLLPVAQLVAGTPATAGPDRGPTTDSVGELELTPNVYWFILDGQAGPPFLRRLGLDPDPFLATLRDHGFDVQEQARSNYPFTHLAIPSALEMTYLYEGVQEPAAGPYFERLQGDNATVDTFLANGYTYVHAYPGLWTGSRCSGREDVCIGDHGPLSDTAWALASATPLIDLLVDDETNRSIARASDPRRLVDLALRQSPARPHVALLHLLNPHPPYLRDARCRVRDVPLSLAAWGEGPEYADAVSCLFDQLAASVDRILAVDEDPVIVIQGDHGPRLGLSAATSGQVLLDDDMYFSAFSAIRLPQACRDVHVPDDLTIVNTWRVVFACLQQREPDLLPDRTFPIRRDYG